MSIDKSLLSGNTAMLLLKLLENKDMYGYEMIEELSEKSKNVFELKAGTLYPLLHTLEKKKYVSSYDVQSESGRARRYYNITPNGKKHLHEKEKEWSEYTSAVNNVLLIGGGLCAST